MAKNIKKVNKTFNDQVKILCFRMALERIEKEVKEIKELLKVKLEKK